jgi:hypothetical protein
MNHIVDGAISFFLQSSELGLPHPLTRRRVLSELSPPPLWGGGGAHSHAGEGVVESHSDQPFFICQESWWFSSLW